MSVALTTWLSRFPVVKGSTVYMNRDSHTCVPFRRIIDGNSNNYKVGPDYESSDGQSVYCSSVAVGP